jgi:hypothetical protein
MNTNTAWLVVLGLIGLPVFLLVLLPFGLRIFSVLANQFGCWAEDEGKSDNSN